MWKKNPQETVDCETEQCTAQKLEAAVGTQAGDHQASGEEEVHQPKDAGQPANEADHTD